MVRWSPTGNNYLSSQKLFGSKRMRNHQCTLHRVVNFMIGAYAWWTLLFKKIIYELIKLLRLRLLRKTSWCQRTAFFRSGSTPVHLNIQIPDPFGAFWPIWFFGFQCEKMRSFIDDDTPSCKTRLAHKIKSSSPSSAGPSGALSHHPHGVVAFK